jgi:hypothetical protein
VDNQDLARALAAEMGHDYAREMDRQLSGAPASPRAAERGLLDLPWGSPADGVSFVISAITIVREVWQKRRDQALLAEDIAQGLEIDARLAYHLDLSRRLGLAAKIVDKLLPARFGSSDADLVKARAEKQRWMEAYTAERQRGARLATRAWTDERTRDFVGGMTILVPFADQDMWWLYQPVGWMPAVADGREAVRVDVPKGFVTDLASVPSYLWSILNRIGRYGNAAIYHDWLYWQQGCTRAQADHVFDRTMFDMGVDDVTRKTIWISVRLFGERYWRENTQAKSAGEKRVLAKFPDRPTIGWEDWRKQADVFAC